MPSENKNKQINTNKLMLRPNLVYSGNQLIKFFNFAESRPDQRKQAKS